eukprot:1178653-Pleurochrysis_carterae.AAC.1
MKCVLLCSATDRFQVWNEHGTEQLEEFVYGRDENGAPLDDSLESKWGLTLEASTVDDVSPVPTLLPPAEIKASQHKQQLCAVTALVAKAFSNALRSSSSNVLAGAPVDSSATADVGITGNHKILRNAAVDIRIGSRCVITSPDGTQLPAYIWGVLAGEPAVVFDDKSRPWQVFPIEAFKKYSRTETCDSYRLLPDWGDADCPMHSGLMECVADRSSRRSPAATLLGHCNYDSLVPYGKNVADLPLESDCWEIYLAYTQGPSGTKLFHATP